MQQINLLQSELRSLQKGLSVKNAASFVGIFLAVIGLITTIQYWQKYSQQQNLLASKQEKEQLVKDIQVISTEITGLSDDSEYKKILLVKEQELHNKEKVLTALTGQEFGNTKGFAEHFTGLSRQHVDGLWLTSLDIHAGGEKLNLQGSTFTPEYVPRYLQNLSDESSFKGVEFKTFLMERDKGSSRVDFDIRSTQKEAS